MREPLSKEQLEAIEKRLKAATPGAWMVYEYSITAGENSVLTTDYEGEIRISGDDVRFIEEAKPDIAALLNEVRRLQSLLEDREEDVAHLSRDRAEEIEEAEVRGFCKARDLREAARADMYERQLAEWKEKL